ncbi:MAG: zf-TFIIB domain-containing protein [Deltaproteobacteria bacterium]|nr:zf-TFIIB domain-containing protein [Deltaproteobacteria bacterium]
MSNSWDDMKRAKEESYFDRKNREALERLAASASNDKPRPSPITGEPMDRVVISGVVVDRCPTSGGIWLDAGELEQIVDLQKTSATPGATTGESMFDKFFAGLKKL